MRIGGSDGILEGRIAHQLNWSIPAGQQSVEKYLPPSGFAHPSHGCNSRKDGQDRDTGMIALANAVDHCHDREMATTSDSVRKSVNFAGRRKVSAGRSRKAHGPLSILIHLSPEKYRTRRF